MKTVTHVVMWTLAASDADKPAVIQQMRDRLTSLLGVIPGLLTLRVEADLGDTEANYDVMLVSEHESMEALEVYQAHPAHIEVGGWIKTLVTGRAAVDYLH